MCNTSQTWAVRPWATRRCVWWSNVRDTEKNVRATRCSVFTSSLHTVLDKRITKVILRTTNSVWRSVRCVVCWAECGMCLVCVSNGMCVMLCRRLLCPCVLGACGCMWRHLNYNRITQPGLFSRTPTPPLQRHTPPPPPPPPPIHTHTHTQPLAQSALCTQRSDLARGPEFIGLGPIPCLANGSHHAQRNCPGVSCAGFVSLGMNWTCSCCEMCLVWRIVLFMKKESKELILYLRWNCRCRSLTLSPLSLFVSVSLPESLFIFSFFFFFSLSHWSCDVVQHCLM